MAHAKTSYVCLPCRAPYKQPYDRERQRICPRCSEPLIQVGSAFAAPRRRDTTAWRTLSLLVNAGVGFHESCCGGPGYRPARGAGADGVCAAHWRAPRQGPRAACALMRHHILTCLVAPPAEPIDAGGVWTVPEIALGVRLPEDYKWLVETYGWGEFCDSLYLRTPFGTSKYNGVEWQSGRLSGAPDRDRERYPYPLQPSPGGLLIWATTMDADRLCWLTVGAPEDWPVGVWSRDGQYETFAMGAAEFIEGWAGGHVSSRQLVDVTPPPV